MPATPLGRRCDRRAVTPQAGSSVRWPRRRARGRRHFAVTVRHLSETPPEGADRATVGRCSWSERPIEVGDTCVDIRAQPVFRAWGTTLLRQPRRTGADMSRMNRRTMVGVAGCAAVVVLFIGAVLVGMVAGQRSSEQAEKAPPTVRLADEPPATTIALASLSDARKDQLVTLLTSGVGRLTKSTTLPGVIADQQLLAADLHSIASELRAYPEFLDVAQTLETQGNRLQASVTCLQTLAATIFASPVDSCDGQFEPNLLGADIGRAVIALIER